MISWGKPKAEPKKTNSRYILGVSAFGEGASAAMLKDGKTIFSAVETQASGGKGLHGGFPSAAVGAALAAASEAEGTIIGVKDLAAVAYCGKPSLRYARHEEAWLAYAPAGLSYFMETAGRAFSERGLAGGQLVKRLAAASWGEEPQLLLYPEYQLCCAASVFYGSPFEDSAILVLDGPGEYAAASLSLGSGERIKALKELDYPDSPQLLAAALAGYAGFHGESAWELFADPGTADPERGKDAYEKIFNELARVREDGSLRLNRKYFRPAEGWKPDHAAWTRLFGAGPFGGGELAGPRLEFAAAARRALEELIYRLGAQAKRLTGSRNLCLCAGTELTLAAEGKLKTAGLFAGLWSLPYSAGESKAAGAALAAWHVHFGMKRSVASDLDQGWTAPVQPELPEESSGPVKAEDAEKDGGLKRLRNALWFWLSLAPRAAWRRLAGSENRFVQAEPQADATFYAAKNRLYAPEDLARG